MYAYCVASSRRALQLGVEESSEAAQDANEGVLLEKRWAYSILHAECLKFGACGMDSSSLGRPPYNQRLARTSEQEGHLPELKTCSTMESALPYICLHLI